MAKRKMLSWMRLQLINHVNEHVVPLNEKKALDAAYKRLEPMVTKIVQKKFPPNEMEILLKYGVAEHDNCIRITLNDSRVVTFSYEGDGVLVPNYSCSSRMYLADARATAAYDAYEKACELYETETNRRREAYKHMINSAMYFEEIVAIWPKAAELLPETALSAPLTPEQIAAIKFDQEEREAA